MIAQPEEPEGLDALTTQALDNTEIIAEVLLRASIQRGVTDPVTITAYALSIVLDAFYSNPEALPVYVRAVAMGLDEGDKKALASKRAIVEAMIQGLIPEEGLTDAPE